MHSFRFVASLLLTSLVLHADAHGALIQHFNEVGSDVVVTFSGSVNLGSTFSVDTSVNDLGARPASSTAGILPSFTASPGTNQVDDRYVGVDLLTADFADSFFTGSVNSSGLFVFNNQLFATNLWFPVLDNNAGDVTVLDASGNLSGRSYAFSNRTFETLGIDQWEGLGPQDLWGVSATPSSTGLVQFQVGSTSTSPVPEPASWLLMVIGAAGVGARRYWRRKSE